MARTPAHVPALVRWSNPVARRLLRVGMPMGPNVLLTVQGRKSGEPRSAAVAIVAVEGRRWVVGAYGDANWVRNLRAAGEADVTVKGRSEHVIATELSREEATAFFRDRMPGVIDRLPGFGRSLLRGLFRLVAPDLLGDPDRAAAARPVFEIMPAAEEPG